MSAWHVLSFQIFKSAAATPALFYILVPWSALPMLKGHVLQTRDRGIVRTSLEL